MSLLSFLKTSQVEEIPVKTGRTGGPRKAWNPAPAIIAIRVWKDGSVFPSQAAVDKFELEYRSASVKKEEIAKKNPEDEQKYRTVYEHPDGPGNGFDVIDSRVWPGFKGDGAMLFVAAVAKNEGKVDLFNQVSYDDTGNPKVSVMDQGSATFGTQVLIPALEDVYGIRFNRNAQEESENGPALEAITDGVDFVDLLIVEELKEGDESFNITEAFSKPILFAPKRVVRGADKGKADYTRRENVKVYGLIPAPVVETEKVPGLESEDEVVVLEPVGIPE